MVQLAYKQHLQPHQGRQGSGGKCRLCAKGHVKLSEAAQGGEVGIVYAALGAAPQPQALKAPGAGKGCPCELHAARNIQRKQGGRQRH